MLRSTAGWIVNDRRVERIWRCPPDNPSNVASACRVGAEGQVRGRDRRIVRSVLLRGVPEHIRSDNGPESSPKSCRTGSEPSAKTACIERGSPWENGFIESFNARFTTNCSTERSSTCLLRPGS